MATDPFPVKIFGGPNGNTQGIISTGAVPQTEQTSPATITNSINSGVSAAQSGLDAILGGRGANDAAVARMNAQGAKIVNQGDAINGLVPQVKAQYDKLDPIAALFGDYGKDLWNEGQSLSEQAKDVFGQGGALVNMDSSAGGLAGEFIKYWNTLDPNNYVSRAASTAQGQIQNQTAQAERNLSRRGVSASSGAFGALQRTAATVAAQLIASEKQKAFDLGLDKQAAQLGKMVDAANTLYNMGNQTEAQANAAKNAAGDMLGKQGSVIQTQAQGYRSLGDMLDAAGRLYGSAASTFGSAQSLNNNFLGMIETAYGRLSSANLQAANSGTSLLNATRSRGGGSTSTGRHYGVGGELLETGNPQIDAQLQMWRDSQNN